MTALDLAPRTTTGWRAGFWNVFRHESRTWWGTRRWWVQLLLWTGVLTAMLQALLWIAEQASGAEAAAGPGVGVAEVFPQYIGIAVLLSIIGVVVLNQGVMLDERRDGMLEWVLAKPVSRTGMVLAKFAAHGLPTMLIFVVVPWAALYGVLTVNLGEPWPLADLLTVSGLVGLLLLSTLALTMLLGAWTTSRAFVIGAPIAAGMLYDAVHVVAQDLTGRLPFPWELTTLATQAAAGADLTSVIPVVATAGWIALTIAATAWRFNREEIA